MKKYLFSLIFLLVSFVVFSQKGLSYQAVVLDPNAIEVPGQDIAGQPLVNGDVWMKFSIYNGSNLQFEEVQKTRTDAYGLVNLMIGSVSTASFNALVWDASQKKLQVHVSFNQGASYTKVSDQKLTYNPYALFAETAGKLGGVLAISGGGTGAITAADARLNLGLDQVNNTSDAAKPVSTATKAALDLKANVADVNAAIALKANITDVTTALALKANTTDITAALAAKADTGSIKSYVLTQVAAAPAVPGLALKENSANKSTNVTTDGASDTKYPSVKSVKTYVDTQVAGATIADANATSKGKIQLAGDLAGTAAAPTVPGLALKENSANKSTNVSTDGASDSKYPSVKAVKTYVDAQLTSGVGSVSISDADVNTKGKIQLTGDLGGTAASPTVPGLALKANATDVVSLTSNLNSNTASITTNTASIAAEVIRATAAELILTNSVLANTASITTNASSIAAETTRATAAELVLTNGVAANTASITANIAAIDLKAPIASPTFTGTLTAPIYATTPQLLTSGSTITWNPTQGLNASVTLDQNSTLSFSVTPPSGSYGTLVVTQDGTGGRTLTLPTTTNKVLGSTSSTSIALSTAAGAKDIINFYYDGTNCYWNVGQGYGTASTTDLASNVSGTLAVANGGTGATTLTGLVKGTGTNALTAAVAGTDYLAPNGSAANLTNFPTLNQNTTGNAATVTTNANLTGDVTSVGNTSTVVKINGTSLASLSTGILKNTTTTGVPTIAVAGTDYQAPLTLTTTGTGAATFSGTTLNIPSVSSTVNSGNISGTIAVANGGTGATTLTGILKGTGTSALTAAIAGTDYQAPLTLTTTGSGSATLSGTTINIPNGVPYSGANAAVDLGAYNLTVNGLTVGQGKSTGTGENTAVGYQVLNNNSASKNTGLGSYAANANTTGHDNVGVGYYALKLNSTGNYNTAIGANAAFSANTSNSNYITAVGYYALRDENNTGNTALGAFAGKPASSQYYSKTTNSTFLGYNTTTSKTDPSATEIPIDNATAIGYGAAVTASNLIQLGNTSITNVKTSGTLTAGDITYPKTHGAANQVLTTTGSGTLTFTTPVVAKPISDQFTATAGQTVFTLTQTPITNTTTSPTVKPNVWMFINGVRTSNLAYTISGATVTYSVANNNSYTIVVGDRVQFDYSY